MKNNHILYLLYITCIYLQLAACFQCSLGNVTSANGWDVICLKSPSNLFSIQHNQAGNTLYVFGGQTLTTFSTTPNFTLVSSNKWDVSFISMHVVTNQSGLWGIGSFTPGIFSEGIDGYGLPLAVADENYVTIETSAGLQGYFLYTTLVDDSNHSDVLSYMVGFYPPEPGNLTQVATGIVRLHLNLNAPPPIGRYFTFDPVLDVVQLNYNTFTTFYSYYKPFLHYDNVTKNLIVVNPSTDNVHQVKIGTPNEPMVKLSSTIVNKLGMSITSSAYNSATNLLYVGYAASGFGDGQVIAYNMAGPIAQYEVVFPGLANPRAIAIDSSTDMVYVGFNGGNAVAQLDNALNVLGYQNLPYYLYQIEAAVFANGHAHFITNEQYSKVARVSALDFCPLLCDNYCSQGKCIPQ